MRTASLAASTLALLSVASAFVPYKLPDLPYAYEALEPAIDKETMMIHHDKHHAGYVKNLNAALETVDASVQELELEELLATLRTLNLTDAQRTAIRNNGGGHWNHRMYWTVMTGQSSQNDISSELMAAVVEGFGTISNLKDELLGAAGKVFGSGWAWLCMDLSYGDLRVTTTANQDNPLMNWAWVGRRCNPILGVDVWEHAYYLKRQNDRKAYLDAFWDLINWEEVSLNYHMGL